MVSSAQAQRRGGPRVRCKDLRARAGVGAGACLHDIIPVRILDERERVAQNRACDNMEDIAGNRCECDLRERRAQRRSQRQRPPATHSGRIGLGATNTQWPKQQKPGRALAAAPSARVRTRHWCAGVPLTCGSAQRDQRCLNRRNHAVHGAFGRSAPTEHADTPSVLRSSGTRQVGTGRFRWALAAHRSAALAARRQRGLSSAAQ